MFLRKYISDFVWNTVKSAGRQGSPPGGSTVSLPSLKQDTQTFDWNIFSLQLFSIVMLFLFCVHEYYSCLFFFNLASLDIPPVAPPPHREPHPARVVQQPHVRVKVPEGSSDLGDPPCSLAGLNPNKAAAGTRVRAGSDQLGGLGPTLAAGAGSVSKHFQ